MKEFFVTCAFTLPLGIAVGYYLHYRFGSQLKALEQKVRGVV